MTRRLARDAVSGAQFDPSLRQEGNADPLPRLYVEMIKHRLSQGELTLGGDGELERHIKPHARLETAPYFKPHSWSRPQPGASSHFPSFAARTVPETIP